MDRKTLITLNGGSSWSRNYRNYSASMTKTAFNISGFIQPAFVEKMLLSDHADGFNDRQLFAFPSQGYYKSFKSHARSHQRADIWKVQGGEGY